MVLFVRRLQHGFMKSMKHLVKSQNDQVLGDRLKHFMGSSNYQALSQLEQKIQALEQDIQEIQERNLRVEADKAWETSQARIIIISILTYGLIVLFFIIVELPQPFINAIIPTIGFILSTLTVPFFKQFWIKYIYKR